MAQDTTAEEYRRFAAEEARGKSALYEEFARGIADDTKLLQFLLSLPAEKRQPNLVLASRSVLTWNTRRLRKVPRTRTGEL